MASSTSSPKTDPETFRQRFRRWMKPPRRLSFTTTGKYFVLLTLGIGFGAINTGNNLLFLLLGMMLSLIVASGILSEAVIRKLGAWRALPARLFAGTPAPGRLAITNPKSFPSLSVEVVEQNPRCIAGPVAGQTVGPERTPWWKFWRFRRSAAEDVAPVARAWCLRVEAGADAELEARWALPSRGRYAFEGLMVVTRFPFGFFEKSLEIDAPTELTVCPTPTAADDWLETVHARFGDVSQNKRGAGEEYFGLRDYRAGEDQRLIHWKSSARLGETVVRETERQEQRAVEVCLATHTGLPAARRHEASAAFEAGLQKTAGLMTALAERGYRVGLRTPSTAVPIGDGSAHIDRMLAALAVVTLTDDHAPLAPDDGGGPSSGRILIGLPDAVDRLAAREDFDLVIAFDASGAADHTAREPGARP